MAQCAGPFNYFQANVFDALKNSTTSSVWRYQTQVKSSREAATLNSLLHMSSDTCLGLLGPVSFVGLPSVEPNESTGPMQANIFLIFKQNTNTYSLFTKFY